MYECHPYLGQISLLRSQQQGCGTNVAVFCGVPPALHDALADTGEGPQVPPPPYFWMKAKAEAHMTEAN